MDNNPQIQLLKSYTPDQPEGSINPNFYTYFGFRDWWRLPLTYPYSIHAIDTLDEGFLMDESAVVDYETSSVNDAVSLIDGITAFTLDRNYLLIKRNSDFMLFDFHTAEQKEFSSEEELFTEAKRLKFDGKYEFMTLREYNELFSCAK